MMVMKVMMAINVSEWSNGLNNGLCLHICTHAHASTNYPLHNLPCLEQLSHNCELDTHTSRLLPRPVQHWPATMREHLARLCNAHAPGRLWQ
jgi:hypothetical protein